MWAFPLTVPATAAGQVPSTGGFKGRWKRCMEVPLVISFSEQFSCLLPENISTGAVAAAPGAHCSDRAGCALRQEHVVAVQPLFPNF